MKAYYIFQQVSQKTVNDIFTWMRDQERAIYCAAVKELTALKKLRPEFVQRKPVQEQFAFIQKVLSTKPANQIAEHLLHVWLLRTHRDMLVTFLDALGIEHDENGIVSGELPESLDAEKLVPAVDTLFGQYPADVVSVYLQLFQLQTSQGWEPLADILTNDSRVTVR